MLGITHFSVFLLSCVVLSVTPGPDSAFIVARSVAGGSRAGLASAFGIVTGCCVHLSATVLGLAALLAASAQAFAVVKWVGAAYLIWLGVRMLFIRARPPARADVPPAAGNSVGRAGGTSIVPKTLRAADPAGVDSAPRSSSSSSSSRPSPSLRRLFWQGFATNLMNPKVILFFVAFFPQFVEPASARQSLAFLLLGLTFIAISLVWNGALALVAGRLTRRIGANPRVRQWIDRAVGGVFVGLGLRMVWLTR